MKFILLTCALIAAVAADVSHLPVNQYLPPNSVAGSAPEVAYAAPAASSVSLQSAPAESFHTTTFHGAVGAPAASYEAAPAASYEAPITFGGAAGAPGASSFEYAASAAAPAFQTAESYQPAASFASHSVEAAPAHTYSDTDGYSYKTQRRVVYRHRQRRDVSHLSNDYLPPIHGSASIGVPTQDYLPPHGIGASSNFVEEYAPSVGHGVEYGGGAIEYGGGAEYDIAGSEPAHSYSADSGYRYRTNRRRVLRRHRQRRDVSHLSNDYLPPIHGSASIGVPTQDYLPPHGIGASSNFVEEYAPSVGHGVEYGGGAIEYGGGAAEYDIAGSEPGHSYSADSGYRYRTNRRRVLRRHRN